MQRLPSFRPRGRSLRPNVRGSCCACGGLEKSDLRMDEDDAEEAAAGSTVKRSPVANALPAAENVAGTNTNDTSPNAGETVHAEQQEMVATEAPTLTGVEGIISDAVKRQPAVDVPMDDAEKTAIGRGMKTSQAPRIRSRKSRRQRRALSECDGPQSMRMQPWMTKRQPSHPRDSIPRSSTGASESVQAQSRSQHRAESEQMGARQRGSVLPHEDIVDFGKTWKGADAVPTPPATHRLQAEPGALRTRQDRSGPVYSNTPPQTPTPHQRRLRPTGFKLNPGLSDDLEDALEALLKETDVEAGVHVQGTNRPLYIACLLEMLDKVPRFARGANVLQFWEERRERHPDLCALAQVALGVPATQVSV
ncbi:hypothetical protein HPB47_018274 [Ixodes persulcatus]|uniref:Uncharacterized protein n=1 Tax=Ixodes persulcatus TaxID=34615 RepID=A0AC60QL59_IXOPE|nr:hypothetical protein HPB47_018274 [Ixodes persulcatus]